MGRQWTMVTDVTLRMSTDGYLFLQDLERLYQNL